MGVLLFRFLVIRTTRVTSWSIWPVIYSGPLIAIECHILHPLCHLVGRCKSNGMTVEDRWPNQRKDVSGPSLVPPMTI